jgi:hypothetical protein
MKFLKINPIYLLLLASLTSSMSLIREKKSDVSNLTYNDQINADNIKTVKLYVNNGDPNSIISPAVNSIAQTDPLNLEFDVLNEDAKYYQAKIILCNWDWTPSILHSIEYLETYNEIEIPNYSYSINTKIPYTHYQCYLPKVLIPGNYVIYVFNRDEPEKVLFERRFIIYENLINIFPSLTLSSGIPERRTHQQIDLSINYQAIEVINPARDIKVVMRQNFSWHNAITGLKPTLIDEFGKTLEYHQFNLENNFPGGNEYRFIDMKSSVSTGRNVDRLVTKPNGIDAFIAIDKPRGYQAYGIWDDINGAYYIASIDGGESNTEADYINTHFFLSTGKKLESDVFLFGEISFRRPMPEYKMTYDPELNGYTGNFLLKEGFYDYEYITSGDQYQIEGNHSETENSYEVIVYYRPPTRPTDLIAGYKTMRSTRNN